MVWKNDLKKQQKKLIMWQSAEKIVKTMGIIWSVPWTNVLNEATMQILLVKTFTKTLDAHKIQNP